MKITDDDLVNDLKLCTSPILNTHKFIITVRERWPLYIKELNELREKYKNLIEDFKK